MGISYAQANDALNTVLLNGRFEGRPLYFSLGATVRGQVASILGCPEAGVEEAICLAVGRSLSPSGNPYQDHVENGLRWWDYYRHAKPPFTAVLMALSHAASLMAPDDFHGGGNYYDRLAEVLEFDVGYLGSHGRSTERLWEWLNSWLIHHDLAFGIPTARAFNKNRYINYAQTQAVIRAGDRHLFHGLFEKFGLSIDGLPGAASIRPYIETWISSSQANSRLKSVWAKLELRDRFCDIVFEELQDWAGGSVETDGKDGSVRLPLFLSASIAPCFPEKERLGLFLGRRHWEGPKEMRFSVEGGTDEFALDNGYFGGLYTVTPDPFSACPGVLNSGLKGTSTNHGIVPYWRPRLVIPLARSQVGPFWAEVNRVTIGEPCMVMVRNTPTIVRKVEDFLLHCSTGEASMAEGGTLAGLPTGWRIYKDVVVLTTDERDDADLAPLAGALEPDGGLRIEGGIPLGNSIWHYASPPTISSHGSPDKQRIFVERLVAPGSTESEQERIYCEGNEVPPSVLRSLGRGEYAAALEASGKERERINFLLRSANRPRPSLAARQGKFKYWCAVSGSVDGHPPPAIHIPEIEPCDSKRHMVMGNGTDEMLIDAAPIETVAIGGAAQGCITRGCHVWRFETYPPGEKPPRQRPAECKECHEYAVFSLRRKRNSTATPGQGVAKASAPAKAWVASTSRESRIDHDTVLDAMCFHGSGTLGMLDTLLKDMIEEPWEATSLLMDYSALGLVDLGLSVGNGRPMDWSIPPMQLSLVSDDEAFVSGFRSESMLDCLKSRLKDVGGSIHYSDRDDVPNKISLRNVSLEGLQLSMEGLQDPIGRHVRIIQDPAKDALASMDGLYPYPQVLRPISLASDDIQKVFDFANARWMTPAEEVSHGAIRCGWAGTTYAWISRSGAVFSGPHQLIKLMAAREAGFWLHEYNPVKEEFSSVLGAEPLGLHARALVACSGDQPTRIGGRTVYQSVGIGIGEAIMGLLYEGEAAKWKQQHQAV